MPKVAWRDLDAWDVIEHVKSGRLTVESAVQAAIDSVHQVDSSLNFMVYEQFDQVGERVAAAPSGPLSGLPFLVKDIGSPVKGWPTSSGSRFLHQVPRPVEGELVRRLRAAGAIVIAKTNIPEFGLAPVTESKLFGPCRNPWNSHHSPGGSSGGSGAAVAAGVVPIAHASDGGGSIRIPASCCGLVGLKTSRGRLPMGPERSESWSGMAVEGFVTRTVRDSALMLDVCAGPEFGAPYEIAHPEKAWVDVLKEPLQPLRIGVIAKGLLTDELASDECLNGLAATQRTLESLGHEVVEHSVNINVMAVQTAFIDALCGVVAGEIARAEDFVGRKATRRDYEAQTWALKRVGETLSAGQQFYNVATLQKAGREYLRQMFSEFDVVLTPTLNRPPVAVGELAPPWYQQWLMNVLNVLPKTGSLLHKLNMVKLQVASPFEYVCNTPVFNISGAPAISLPLHMDKGRALPVGMHFGGPFGREDVLLQLAAQLEGSDLWQPIDPAIKTDVMVEV